MTTSKQFANIKNFTIYNTGIDTIKCFTGHRNVVFMNHSIEHLDIGIQMLQRLTVVLISVISAMANRKAIIH